MADIKITCPHCQQGIQCDQLWCGHEINCPTCQGRLVVPHTEAPAAGTAGGRAGALGKTPVPAPPQGAAPRLSAGRTQVARAATGTGAPQKPFQRPVEKKGSPLLKFALIGLGVVALAGGGYYGYTLFLEGKDKVQATAQAAAKRPVGGEVGAAMDANDALEGNRSDNSLKAGIRKHIDRRRTPGVPSAGDSAAALGDDSGGGRHHGPGADAPDNLPTVAPVYTLDLSAAVIPVSKVNGLITGGAFIADKARIDKINGAYALTLRQGAGPTPDRAVRVFLRLKGNEVPTNQTFSVSSDASDPSVSQVSKLWKTAAGFMPNEQKYASNYALKLEMGSLDKGSISGKIFLALTDAEKTVVAGQFKAALVPEQVTQATPFSVQPRAAPGGPMNPYSGRNMRQRARPGMPPGP
jgi:hypothetical protein